MSSWGWSTHARKRRKQMGIGEKRVEDVLNNPTVDYPSKEGVRIAKGQGFAVAYDPKTKTVISVLWDEYDEYKRGQRKWSPGNT